jgi:TRAP-type C4-dicarboxylate transport system permease small subunit
VAPTAGLVDWLERRTVPFTRIVAFLGLVALLGMAAIILANAVMSWLWGAPLDGVRDWIKLIVAIAVAACIPAVLATRQNITIRFLGHVSGGRWDAGFEAFGAIVTWLVLAALTWQLQDYVFELYETGETTENLGMPIAPWWQVVVALFALSVAVQTLVVLSLARAVARGVPLPRHGASPDEV